MPKGIPVPNTGRKSPAALRAKTGRERPGAPNGVMGSSRILPHRYAGDGDTGAWFRRIIRHRENVFWRAESRDELYSE